MKRVRYKTRRARLEAAIERAIALLDQLDADPDLEPSLGSMSCVGSLNPDAQMAFNRPQWDQERWARGGADDDREDEHDGIEPDNDVEPPNQPPVGDIAWRGEQLR